MLITKTPLRVSLIGGGTDIPSFFQRYTGAVVSMAINKYVYISVNKKFDGTFRISYSKTENVKTIDEIEHDLVREALRQHGIKVGLEITSVSDIPGTGTGLGSSSAFTVGLVNALSQEESPSIIAERAWTIEAEKCLHPGVGKQDHYASTCGGINFFTFNRNNVVVKPIAPSSWWLKEFESHFLLLYTGITRDASKILKEQDKTFREGGNMEIGKQLAMLASEFHIAMLDECPMEELGVYLQEAWKIKRFLASGITSPNIDALHDTAMQNGAFGGKLLGAGGGGFLFFLAPPDTHRNIIEKTGLRAVDVKIENEGSKIIYGD